MNQNQNPLITTRRQFLKDSSVAVGGIVAAANLNLSQNAFAADNSDTIRVGLIGCGGRGTGAASQALHADKNVALVAMGDAYPEKLQNSLETLKKDDTISSKIKVDPDHCFIGLDAYRKVIDSGVDLVILATPPGFRPMHFKAAVEASKNIFCEKPMATDAPGIRSVMESVEEAKKRKLAVVAGFCWRYDYARRAIFEQIHDGKIGDIRTIYATYYTTPVKPMPPASKRTSDITDLDWQLRNWYNFTWLGGDGLVEQAVHSVDKIAWAMKDVPPLEAVAVGGRQISNNEGNIYDHFEVNYLYAHGVRGFMGCRQQTGCYSQNADYIIGATGIATIGVGPTPEIKDLKDEQVWHYTGPKNEMYQTEHDELFASIRAGKPINDGVRMCSSTLMALMGRIAAYTGQKVSWDQALHSQEKLVPDQLDWNMKLPIPPMAMPGRTKLV